MEEKRKEVEKENGFKKTKQKKLEELLLLFFFSLPKLNLPLSHRAHSQGAVQPEVDVFCSWLTGASEDDS